MRLLCFANRLTATITKCCRDNWELVCSSTGYWVKAAELCITISPRLGTSQPGECAAYLDYSYAKEARDTHR